MGSESDRSKTVVITGCSSGFGKLMAERFWQRGWNVIATTRHPDLLSHLAAGEGAGCERPARIHVLPLNVADAEDRRKIVSFVRDNYPAGLDCLVNNAGYSQAGPLESLTEEQIRQQFEVNVFAPTLLIKELLPSLRRAKGKVINVSSVFGFVGMPLQSMYVSSKFALEGLTESLYYELSPHGVQVTIVEPGGFRTSFAENIQWPGEGSTTDSGAYTRQLTGLRKLLQRAAQRRGNNPEQVASAIVALAHKRSVPLRVRIGADCQALYYMRRSLPQRNADRLLLKLTTALLNPN